MFTFPFNSRLEDTLNEKEKQLPKVLAVSGKGGTGKTTVTAALACNRASMGKKVLVVSIDPAHSLGDALEMDLSDNKVHEVTGMPNLLAWEIDLAPSKDTGQIGTHNDVDVPPESLQKVIGDVFFPISEEANVIYGIMSVFNFIHAKKIGVEEIFIDGAPSGHFLRVLSFPMHMDNFLGRIMRLQQGLKALFEFNGRKRKLVKKKILMGKAFKRMMNFLKNKAIASFILVTIPETLSLMETRRTHQYLEDMNVNTSNIIINRIHQAKAGMPNGCYFCSSRIAQEREILESMRNEFRRTNLVEVPLLPGEVHGIDNLMSFSNLLIQ